MKEENNLKKILWISHQKDDGIEVDLTTTDNCLTEINELRQNLKSVLTDLEKFKGMKAYDSLSTFETKYIDDAVLICENQLNVKYVLNSDKEAKECDATAAPSIDEPLAQKNPLEDITECYVPVSVEDEPPSGKHITEDVTGNLFECFFDNGWYILDGHGERIEVPKNEIRFWLKKITLPSPAVNNDEVWNELKEDVFGIDLTDKYMERLKNKYIIKLK